ncbi:MAG: DUF1315 family protein [Gammaproteobacteria bacterium]|jgi:hypothetical protein|nr:DUF1315 family protein [Gammaproteobacteria bacterium]MDP6535575.1 DUF1315 family protein [Gammaproteobacteria bacterium]MDP6731806.1 DUF1315 family protein [Gammaproteobacteria bacterium]|tara:strand:+ start:1474 stop:1809 length:336 start_codon:yes stop_codon:yes gene_type:complete
MNGPDTDKDAPAPPMQALLQGQPQSIERLVEAITPVIYEALKSAVELGKWQDGTRLVPEQIEYCLQAIILYEARHLPAQQRTGTNLKSNKLGDPQEVDPLAIRSVPLEDES